jgi:hypothetical protein
MKPSNRSVNESKKEAQRDRTFVRGGGAKMFGRGSRTTTSTPDAAGKQQPGQTASISKTNPQFARGGKPRAVGGFARPAKGGQTGT